MSLLISCPQCLHLFPWTGPADVTALSCPLCQETFVPAQDAVPEKTVWYVLHGQHKYGPFILTRLQQLSALGWIGPHDRITRLGAAHWQPAGRLEFLFPAAVAPQPAAEAGDDEVSLHDLPGGNGKGPLSCQGITVHPDRTLTLGDFQILKKLGAGNMGAVYLAHQRSKDRLVALKMLAKHLAVQQGYVDRFYREAEVLARLEHPCLIRFYGVGAEKEIPYFAMEFVEGISAARALRHLGGRFPVADAVRIILHCADALGYAHAQRVVHRDVKPENVMITRQGDIKVTDLGLAKPLDADLSLTESGIGMGTPHYMSPEQARNAKHVEPRSDIYALGGVLYHFLTGQPPWKGDSVIDLQHDKELGIFPPARRHNPDVPPALDIILGKMMARKPEQRYPDCAALSHDLNQLGVAGARLSFNPLRIINGGPAPPPCAERVEVVLIHDHGEDIALTQEALEASGVPSNLSAVANGPEAVSFFRHEGKYAAAPRPRLIVLGRELHDCDCFQDLGPAHIPVAVLTSDMRSLATLKTLGRHAPSTDARVDRLIHAVQQLFPPTIAEP